MKMYLTSNYITLSRNLNGPGLLVHRSTGNEYIHLTFHKCVSFDEELEVVDPVPDQNVINRERIQFRIQIGNSDSALFKTCSVHEDSVTLTNLPVPDNTEIWISCSVKNKYCVYGHVTKNAQK